MTAPNDEAERPVDVGELRRKVQAVARAARNEGTLTPERAREVLRERAQALAVMPAREVGGDETLELITFTLAGERFAAETRSVLEVFRLADLTTLPGAQAPVLGLTAWRGRLLTVLDLRAALGISTTALNDLAYVIVFGAERAAFGVLADAMTDVVAQARADVRAPSEGLGARRAALLGFTPDALMIIDASHLVREFGEGAQATSGTTGGIGERRA
ncbi:MAG: chemotaxis protein CheW [Gemmatimonadota bacterium]|nr:chemotaxis protein CheW [Gemmatimonadota bacterium]